MRQKETSMKANILCALLLLGACGAKENKEAKKDAPTAAVNKPVDATLSDSKPADAKPEEAKPAEAKPADAKPAEIRTTLLPIDDKDLKCSSTETKITEFKLDGKVLDASNVKESYAYYQGTEQVLTLSSKPLENKEKFNGWFDKAKLKKGEYFFFIAFNRRNGDVSIAPELGVYKTMSDDPAKTFQASLAVYTTESAPPIAATNVVLEGISTTRICGSFEFYNYEGANILRGTFNVPNTVR
jgi:hypothetical protein